MKESSTPGHPRAGVRDQPGKAIAVRPQYRLGARSLQLMRIQAIFHAAQDCTRRRGQADTRWHIDSLPPRWYTRPVSPGT